VWKDACLFCSEPDGCIYLETEVGGKISLPQQKEKEYVKGANAKGPKWP